MAGGGWAWAAANPGDPSGQAGPAAITPICGHKVTPLLDVASSSRGAPRLAQPSSRKTSAAAAEVSDMMVLNYEMMSQKEVDKMKSQAAAAAKRAETMEAQLKKQMTSTAASSSSGAAAAATAEPDEVLNEADVKPLTKTKGKASK